MPAWLPPLLFAPFAGSLVGVLIRRLPAERPVAWARSACAGCGARLGPAELVPLLSYALSGGRCRHCRSPIGRFHPAVEAAAVLVAASAALAVAAPARLWADCILGWGLLALGWIDAETLLLPDLLTLPLVLAGLGATLGLDPGRIGSHAAGAAAGWLGFRGLALAYRHLRGREGLGEGDAKLLAAAGAWAGWRALPGVVLLAALLGLAWAGLAHLRGRTLGAASALPFGPFLALALWIVVLAAG